MKALMKMFFLGFLASSAFAQAESGACKKIFPPELQNFASVGFKTLIDFATTEGIDFSIHSKRQKSLVQPTYQAIFDYLNGHKDVLSGQLAWSPSPGTVDRRYGLGADDAIRDVVFELTYVSGAGNSLEPLILYFVSSAVDTSGNQRIVKFSTTAKFKQTFYTITLTLGQERVQHYGAPSWRSTRDSQFNLSAEKTE